MNKFSLEMLDDKIKEKNDRLIDTLIIVCGFVIAGSYEIKNTLFLYFIFGFLTFSILSKSTAIDPPSKYLSSLIYGGVSFFFPLVLFFFFYINETFLDSPAPYVLTPAFSIILLTTFIEPLKKRDTFFKTLLKAIPLYILFFILDLGAFLLMQK